MTIDEQHWRVVSNYLDNADWKEMMRRVGRAVTGDTPPVTQKPGHHTAVVDHFRQAGTTFNHQPTKHVILTPRRPDLYNNSTLATN